MKNFTDIIKRLDELEQGYKDSGDIERLDIITSIRKLVEESNQSTDYLELGFHAIGLLFYLTKLFES